MKIFLNLLIIVVFLSCNGEKETDNLENTEELEIVNQVKIYRSSEDSFQKNFYLKIENKDATIYGWEINLDKDTIYYRSKSKLEQDSSGVIRIRLDKYEMTNTKITENNLNDFKEDKEINFIKIFMHSDFSNGKLFGNSIQFIAVKHIYDSRSDNFKFEIIK